MGLDLHDVYGKYLFHLDIDGITVAGFNKAGGFGYEIEEKEYREAANPTAIRRMRRFTKVKDLTLQEGMTRDTSLWGWAFANADYINSGDDAKRDVTLSLLDRAGFTTRQWMFGNAWVKEWEIQELDAQANEVLLEKVVIAAEYIVPDI